MKARAGDHIIVAAPTTAGVIRDGEIVEIRGPAGGPPYVVRWSDDGTTGLFFPGSDAHVSAAHLPEVATPAEGQGPPPDAPVASPDVRTWRVDIELYEAADNTTAHAVLVAEAPQRLDANGAARRNPTDVAVPEIGDEIAVARALRRLSDRLFATASADITAVQGQSADITK